MIILNYIYGIFYDIKWAIPFIIIFVIFFIIIFNKKGYQNHIKHGIGIGIFILYLLMLLESTIPFINIYMAFVNNNLFSNVNNINLIPLRGIETILKSGNITAFMNIFGNILMFIPFGLFLPLFWKKFYSIKKIFLYAFVFSLLIEIIQLFSFRGTDIDDVILNTSGALIGYSIYIILIKYFPSIKSKCLLK